MADITMSLDDTLELDAIIQEWNNPENVITDSDGQFNISGFQTNTGVLDPQNTGEHKIVVNGQELTVKVTDPSTIPDSGVLRYEFEQDVTDSWNGYDATDNTSTGYVSGAVGSYAKDYDGVDDYVSYPSLGIFSPSSPYSIAFWINPDATGPQELMNTQAEYDTRFIYDNRGNQHLEYQNYDGLNASTALSSASVDTGMYTMVGYTYDGAGTVRIGVNDTLESDQTVQTDYRPKSKTNVFGKAVASDRRPYDGAIDDLRFYSKPLSGTEWSNLYNTGGISG